MTENINADKLVHMAAKDFEKSIGNFVVERDSLFELLGITSTYELADLVYRRGQELGLQLGITVIEKVPGVLEVSWQPRF